jgi:hypothetical protein
MEIADRFQYLMNASLRSRIRAAAGYFLFLLLLPLQVNGATFTANGTNLTVASSNIQVSFSGADVVGITNLLTSESYLRSPSPNMQLNLTLVTPPTQGLAASGGWMVSGSSATLSFTDSNRLVSVTVSVDPATQEVVVSLNGTASSGGVEQLIWGVTGFDMSAGKFVLPAQGGLSLNAGSFAAQSSYYFFGDAWEAPVSLFQGNLGGAAIYSRDTQSLCKDLQISANQLQTSTELFYVEAPGPWNTATQAGPIEWRLAAYSGGDWQTGASIYRDWHTSVVPPVPLTGGRAWVNNITTVIEEDSGTFPTSDLDSLKTVVNPSETLLYLVNWRANGYDVGYPDYSWASAVPAFITYAHSLGFHVMLHTDALGVAPTSSDYASVQQYQLKNPLTLQLEGWNWNLPASTPNRYALIDPAASAYRSLFVARVSPAIQTLNADAIHLDFSVITNDGNGLIQGKNFNQGLSQLETDLLAAFPNLVLGLEEINDSIAAQASFGQPLYWSSMNLSSEVTPPVPISAYALPNVRRYWHLGVTNPYDEGFVVNLEQYEGQAVLPTFHSGVSSYTQTDMARFLGVINAFQTYNLQPAWDTAWNGAIVKYQGTGGVTATLTDTGTIVQFATQNSSTVTNLYQRAHGVNQLNSSLAVDNWPAYNGTLTLGLDPLFQYWLDNTANNPALPHVTGLPAGVRIGLGTGTLVTPNFAYFQLLPPVNASFNFFSNLWLASLGVSYAGTDYPLQNGATEFLTQMTVGGVTRQAIFTQPPFTAQRGGDIFFQYSVPVPSGSGGVLSFAAGINDSAIGQRSGPMTFKVEINGAIVWQEDVSTGGWQAGSLNLGSYAGQTVTVRFITDPGPSGNPNFGWGGWSALQLAVAGDDTLNGISLSVPPSITSSQIALSGGTASVSSGTVTVNGLPSGGTVLVFPGSPVAVSAGQSLLNIPFTLSQSSNTQLAGPPVGAFAGTGVISSTTSGGVTKPSTLYAFAPPNGQTIFSWLLQLPASPALSLSFSAGYWDGGFVPRQNYLMSVRVNGTVLWQESVGLPTGWQYGAVGLSQWSGQTVLVELITDSQGPNWDDFTSWAELSLSASGPGASCNSTLGGYGPINAPSGGASGMLSVTTASNCEWLAGGESDWITATQSVPSGNGTVTYTIAPNLGAARQSALLVAGTEITVSQSAFVGTSGDFDGGGKADYAVWRPSNGTWYVIPSSNPSNFLVQQWGISTDVSVRGDFDGDGKTDYAVWRPSNGTWYVIPSSNPGSFLVQQWGVSGDIPVPGDYDGDGKTDFAVWRPSTGTWFIIPSSNPSSLIIQQWGASGDIPVPGDYDGDGKTDFGVWRPSNGTWYVIPSSNPGNFLVQQWGVSGDDPVPGDYDGDGKTDFAVWRPSNGTWYVIPSSTPNNFLVQQWGVSTDIPTPADYDGDRKIDFAVWRPSNGTWYVIPSSAPMNYTVTQWGTSGDVPIEKPTGQ